MSANLYGRRVLIADDEAFSRSIIERMVGELGCHAITLAADGAEALAALSPAGCNLSLAILDFNMPKYNGLQLLQQIRLRKLGAQHDIHVMMLTGSSDLGLVGAAMALDVDAFVVKPVTSKTFASRVEKLLGEYRDIKSVSVYEKVDIDSVSRTLLPSEAVGLTEDPVARVAPLVTPAPGGPPTWDLPLDTVMAGMVLARPITGPSGELMLGKDIKLTDRLIRRLKELQQMLGIEMVTVYR